MRIDGVDRQAIDAGVQPAAARARSTMLSGVPSPRKVSSARATPARLGVNRTDTRHRARGASRAPAQWSDWIRNRRALGPDRVNFLTRTGALSGFVSFSVSRCVCPTPSAAPVGLNNGLISCGEVRLDTDGATALTMTWSVPSSDGSWSDVVTAPPATGVNRNATAQV